MQNFFFKKSLFEYKIQNAVEIKPQKKSSDNFKNIENFVLSPLKNASHTISMYGNCMISFFLTKT